MTTTIKNEHKKLNVPNSTDKGNAIRNVPHLRFPKFSGEWKESTIDKLATKVGSGVTPRGGEAVYKSEGHPFVRSQNVGWGHLMLGDIAYIDEETHKRQKGTELQLNDILLNITGASIGRSALVDEQIVGGNVNQHVCIIRANEKLVPSFLCNFLLSRYGQKQIDSFQAGGNRQGLNFEQIKSIKIGLPSVEEQKKIADLLQLLEQRIVTQNKIIEDLKKLKSALSKKLLSSDNWKIYKIQDIAEIGRGRVISSVEIERQKHPQYPVYSSQTSNDGIMGYLDEYMFDGEYITWTTDGANAGTVFYRNGKFNCTNVCGTLKIKSNFDCHFVSLVLQQATQSYVSSNLANPKLMNNTMATIKIRIPDRETQEQLSKVFKTLENCLLVHQRTCEKYQIEKQYLLRQMFI